MKLNNLKIGTRINLVIGLTFLIITGGIGLYTTSTLKNQIVSDMNKSMSNEVTNLKDIIDVQVESNQEKVNIAIELAHEYFYNLGNIRELNSTIEITAKNQVTRESKQVQVNKWELNNSVLQASNKIVDEIKQKAVETATIFQKIEGGYLRISTNVLKENGERATGTYIPNNSEVIKTIENGETFKGRAYVVNTWYRTAYEPIKINGEVKGILYVGVKEANMGKVSEIFKSKSYYGDGYPYVVNSKGIVTIHPETPGIDISEENFFKKILEGDKKGHITYDWEDRTKYAYYEYSSKIDSYIATSFYEDNMLEIISNIRSAILLTIFIGIAVFILIIFFLSKNITNGLKQGVEMAKKVAEGNLEAKIDINSKDEVGELANALSYMNQSLKDVVKKAKSMANGDLTVNIDKRSDEDELLESLSAMIHKLREIIGTVTSSARNVSSASQEMSSSSQQVSQGASEQASSTEEVSSSMEEMTSNIQQNTDNAQQTEKIAAKAAEDIDEGSKNVNQTVEAMKQIAEKVSIIGDIAFQTNILALNAAVEAARAGEHGKGFAVVAAEVRKLAERSQHAAGEIDELTGSSVAIAEKSGKLLEEIVPDIQKTSKLVQEITAASTEQNSGADQINNAITQLNEITQQNAAASEEMATASEELSSQSEQLLDIVSFFKIDQKDLKNNKIGSEVNLNLSSNKQLPKSESQSKEKSKDESKDSGFNIDMNTDNQNDKFEDF